MAQHVTISLQYSSVNSHFVPFIRVSANYPSLFYIKFLSMVESCVQDNRANYLGGAN